MVGGTALLGCREGAANTRKLHELRSVLRLAVVQTANWAVGVLRGSAGRRKTALVAAARAQGSGVANSPRAGNQGSAEMNRWLALVCLARRRPCFHRCDPMRPCAAAATRAPPAAAQAL